MELCNKRWRRKINIPRSRDCGVCCSGKESDSGYIPLFSPQRGGVCTLCRQSTLKILKIENYGETGNIIHISISALNIKNPNSTQGFLQEINHIPICEKALENSVTTVKTEASSLPDFDEGYSIWKKDFDEKKAGVFSITVSEIVKYIEDGLNQCHEEEANG